MAGAPALDGAVQAHAELVTNLDLFKQCGLYTDCVLGDEEQPVWSEPSSRITKEQARTVVECARMTASKPDISLQDIELFVEHFGPVYGHAEMIKGYRKWLRAMEVEGLLHASCEEMEDRVLDGFLAKVGGTATEPSAPMSDEKPFVACGKTYLDGAMVTGQYSDGLVREIDAHFENRTANPFPIIEEIGA